MKKILLDSTKNFYKANLHCHSTKSDGRMTVEEIKNLYKENGYSVIAFTDHEHIIDNSYLNDKDFLTITSCEVAVKEFEEFSTLKKRNMKVCHFNFYAKDEKNIDTPCYSSVYDHFVNDDIKDTIIHSCGEYKRDYSPEAIRRMIDIANQSGFLVSYNHPRWSLENARDYLEYKGIWAVEVYNTSSDTMGHCEYNINAYDDFLRDGNKIACTFCDDNHSMADVLGGFTMINADELSYPTIIKALENHSFYASQGPVIKSLYIEDDTAYMTFEKGEYAVMSTGGRRIQKITAENPDGENTVSFKILPDEDIYIRFRVTDKFGKHANTNAYFTEDIYND